ncbi:MAG TPA: hypothetical protein VFJ16_31020 [Longimicrobium sp.]|nr:hypothetical protein [Longimicrobium sp.]
MTDVIIRVTGLILFARPGGNDKKTYLLFPATPIEMEHVAQIGFAGENTGCDTYENGICFLNIDNWSITLGDDKETVNNLPSGRIDRATKKKVRSDHFSERKRRQELKARVVLRDGGMVEHHSCGLGTFEYASEGDIKLLNVVEWKFTIATSELKLERRWMYGGKLGNPVEIRKLTPGTDNIIEIYIRHIPVDEVGASSGPVKPLPNGEPPPHWHMFHDLLTERPASPPFPKFKSLVTEDPCKLYKNMENIATLNCPVGSSDPL